MPSSLITANYSIRTQMSNCRVRSIHSGALTAQDRVTAEIDGKYHVDTARAIRLAK